ncbi:hypothetical protein FACS1894177_08910 [Bacteroidia bacterium]|nr:hypothetical protein FACS1894177_08910 [Bacteroidia bacterium]
MKIKNSKIILTQQFRELHPRGLVSDSDLYYTRLANRIFQTLMHDKPVTINFEPHLLNTMALHAAAYLEDTVSGLGIFAAFRNIHQKLCNRKIPFLSYSDEDYFDEEINQPDVQLLVWFIKQEDRSQETKEGGVRFVNPENPMIEYVSSLIMNVLEEEYEIAPENPDLYYLLHLAEYDNYFQLREILQWLHYDSYLSMQYPKEALKEAIQNFLNSKNESIQSNLKGCIYTVEVGNIYTYVCSPLAIKAVDWLKEITTNENIQTTIETIEYRSQAIYEIISRFGDEIKISPIDDKNKILYLDANSVTIGSSINYFTASLVRFNNLWQANGQVALLPDIDEEQRKKLKQNKEEHLNEDNFRFTYEAIMKFTKNKPLLFFKNFDNYLDFWAKVFPNTPNMDEFAKDNILKDDVNLALFANEKTGVIILPDVASWIKLPGNKLYNKAEASKYAISLLLGSTSTPLDLLSHLIENNLLPDAVANSFLGKERGRQLVQDNQWFIVRFFQPDLFLDKMS